MAVSFVVDNSVVMAWAFEDEASPYADAVLERLTETAVIVPAIWPLEVVNVLLVAERRQRLRQADSVRFLTLLSHLPIFVDHSRPERRMEELLSLGRTRNLSSYDAAYLDLAMRKGLPIATLDQKLMNVAQQIEVPILPIT